MLNAKQAWKNISQKRKKRTGENKILSDKLLESFILEKIVTKTNNTKMVTKER